MMRIHLLSLLFSFQLLSLVGLHAQGSLVQYRDLGGGAFSSGRTITRHPGAAAPGKQHDVLRVLLQGRREEAITMATDYLRSLTEFYLKPDGRHLIDAHFAQFARAYGLAEAILEQAVPEPDAPLAPRLQHAALCEMLGQWDRAKEAYRDVLQAEAGHDGARSHLAMLLVRGEPAEAAELIRGTQPEALSGIGQELANLFMSQRGMEDRLNVFEVLVAYVDALEGAEEGEVNMDFLPSVFQMIGQGHYEDDVRVGELFSAQNYRFGFNHPEQAERSERAERRRRELFERFCLAVMKLPRFASEGFRYYAGVLSKNEGEDDETDRRPLEDLALRIVLQEPATDEVFQDPNAQQNFNESWVPLLTPQEYLSAAAVERNDFNAITSDYMPQLEGAGKREAHAFLRAMADLHATPSDAFIEKAGSIIEANHPRVNSEHLLRQINAMIDQRKMEVDRGPLIYSRLAAMKSTQYIHASYVLSYAQEQAKEGAEVYRAFLRRVAEVFLGPTEGQKALIESHYRPNYHEPGSPNGAILSFVQFLGHMMNDLSLAAPAIALADELSLFHPQEYQLSNQVQNLFRSHRLNDQPQVFYDAFLRESPFLDGPETFRTYRMARLSRTTVFGFVLEQLSNISPNSRDRILDPIRDHQPARMGQQLILAHIDATNATGRGRAVAAALEPHMDAIRKLPEERQDEFVWWLQEYFSKGTAIPPLVRNNSAKFTKWLEERHAQPGALEDQTPQNRRVDRGAPPAQAEVDTDFFLNTTGRGDFRNTGMTLENYAVLCLTKASSAKEFDAFDRIFAHYAELSAPTEAEDERSAERHLYILTQFLQTAPSLESVGLVIKWLQGQDDASLRDHPGLRQTLQLALGAFDFDNPQVGLDALLQASGGVTDPLLAPLWIEACQRLARDRESVDRLLRWTDQVGDDPVRKEIAADIHLAGQLSVLEAGAPAEAKTAVEQACLQELQAPEATLAWRHFIAMQLIQPALRMASPVLARACLQTLAETPDEENASAAPQRPSPFVTIMHVFLSGPLPESMKPVAREFLTLLAENSHGLGLHQLSALNDLCGTLDYPLEKVVRSLPEELRYQPGFVAAMMQAGLVEMATEAVPWTLVSMPPMLQLQDNRRSIRRVINGNVVVQSQGSAELQPGSMNSTIPFDDSVASALPGLLNDIEDAGSRYAIELILAASADANGDEAAAARAERLADLRARFRIDDFSSPELARHSLGWLLCLDPTEITDAMREGIRRFGPQLDVALFSSWGDPFKAPLDAIARVHLLDSLRNDPLGFAGIVDRQLDAITDRPEEVQQFLEQYLHQFPDGVFDDLKSMDQDKAALLLPLFRTLSSLPESIYFRRRSECVNGNVACHILAGQSRELAEWFEGLNDRRDRVERYIDFDTVINLLATGLTDEGIPPERKEGILNGIFTNEILVRRSSNGALFQNLIDRNLIDTERLLDRGPEWAALNPRGGAAYNELANYQVQAGRDIAALDSYLNAVMESSMENSSEYATAAVAKAELLMKLDRLDSAMTWFAFVQRGRLNSNDQQRFDQLYREARSQYLRDRKRAVSLLTECRRRLEEKSDDAEAWRELAEVYASLGQQRIDGGDYLGASTMLKVAFHIFRGLQQAGVPGIEPFFEDSKNALVKAQSAIGMASLATTLIERQSRWSYHYGEEPAPASWEAPDFQTKSWRIGRGSLGYGDGDERTRLNFGNDEKNKPITAYFRLAFEVDNLELLDTLSLGARHDDGIVIYLNGKELVRHNMPSGSIERDTLASGSRNQERTYWEHTFSAALLQPGTNVIAAEVHQHEPESSDLGFDLYLQSEAINVENVVAEMESGTALGGLGEWKAYLPNDYATLLKALRRFP